MQKYAFTKGKAEGDMETLILVLHREGLPGELIPKLLLRPEEWQSNGALLKLTQTGNGKPRMQFWFPFFMTQCLGLTAFLI